MQLTDYRLPTTAQKAEDSRLKTVDRTSAGFTLVELLVVISIVGILSVIGLILYSTSLKQGKDSKREADLKAIQLALEQYINDQGFYPASNPSPFTPGSALTNLTGNPTVPAPTMKSYMDPIPNDSQAAYPYCYKPLKAAEVCSSPAAPSCSNAATAALADKCTKYCLYAKLENSDPVITNSCNSISGYNLIVSPP